MTFTSPWSFPSGKVFPTRKSGPYAIRIYHAMRPVRHGEGLPVPELPDVVILESGNANDDEICDISEPSPSKDPLCTVMSGEPHRITQNGLNDRIRDLKLPKCKVGLLGLRLQQWNCLDDSVRVSVFPCRQKDMAQFFKMECNLFVSNDGGGMYININ